MFSFISYIWCRFYYGCLFIYRQFFVPPPYPMVYWSGKVVIVTGGTSGLGMEAACHFVQLGAEKVIITTRHAGKGNQAIDRIVQQTGRKGIAEAWALDLCSYESVKAFWKRAERLGRLDAVVLNAGMATPRFEMAEQDESTITTNVVSPFLLALLLVPKLKVTAAEHRVRPHLSFVSSEVIFQTRFPEGDAPKLFDELSDRRKARMWSRYNVSKLMVAMLCREVSARYHDDYPLVFNYLNPGLCQSDILRHLPSATKLVMLLLARTAEEGSRLLVHAASAGPASHGQYLSDAKISEPPPLLLTKRGVVIQRKLWQEAVERLEFIQPGIMENLS